ncbi:hypothetical protein, partial [uncultured Clostridium sp.]|uniref:hypothetical protein n=1 Tax=uncultured Clostridium sp. TaxID=59620 RepID=UPI00262AB7AF
SLISNGASLAPQLISMLLAVLPVTFCKGLFNQIHRKFTFCKSEDNKIWLKRLYINTLGKF